MTNAMRGGLLTFDCDEPGCHNNFESNVGEFRAGWREAQSEGWIYLTVYEKSVSTAKHYCPHHADKYEGGPRE